MHFEPPHNYIKCVLSIKETNFMKMKKMGQHFHICLRSAALLAKSLLLVSDVTTSDPNVDMCIEGVVSMNAAEAGATFIETPCATAISEWAVQPALESARQPRAKDDRERASGQAEADF